MNTYTPQDYTVTMTVSDEQYEDMTRNYATSLAKSMQLNKDKISEQVLTKLFMRDKRDSGGNEYLHGALNAIREQTKTV